MEAEYYFHLDEEAQAYRIIGLVARMCFEMGLHRREILAKSFVSENNCFWAVRLFWSIYVLDRRWSFGTGMPFAIQDSDIDSSLPEPVRQYILGPNAARVADIPRRTKGHLTCQQWLLMAAYHPESGAQSLQWKVLAPT